MGKYIKDNIVLFRSGDALLADTIDIVLAEMQNKFPSYEIIEIEENKYLNFFAKTWLDFKRFVRINIPFIYTQFDNLYRKYYNKKAAKKSDKFKKDEFGIMTGEGRKTGIKKIMNIAHRFEPKCLVSFDSHATKLLVGAKNKFELLNKVVCVLSDSMLEDKNFFYSVDTYIALNNVVSDKLLFYGYPENHIKHASLFSSTPRKVQRSLKKMELSLSDKPVITFIPTLATKKAFLEMIQKTTRAMVTFDILLYCKDEKIAAFFTDNAVTGVSIIDDLDAYMDATDYLVTVPSAKYITQGLQSKVMLLLYGDKKSEYHHSTEFYDGKGLGKVIHDHTKFDALINELLTDATLYTRFEENLDGYFKSLEKKSIADCVAETAKKYDLEQPKKL